MIDDTPRHVIVEDETLAAGFTQIPNAILRRPDVSPGAKLTYVVLLSYAWQRDNAYPGQDRLAADMGVTDRSVRTYLDQLEAAKLITVQRRGLGQTNVYTIHRLSRPENISALDRKPASGQERKSSTVQDRKDLPPKKTQGKKTQTKKDDLLKLLDEPLEPAPRKGIDREAMVKGARR